jgi:phosphoglycolate phosphatase
VIQRVIEQLSPGVVAAAMIGDRADDIIASTALGIPGIGVGWGFGSVDELVESGAECVVGSPTELPGVISRIGTEGAS